MFSRSRSRSFGATLFTLAALAVGCGNGGAGRSGQGAQAIVDASQMGINVNSLGKGTTHLSASPTLPSVYDLVQQLGAGWVRLEIDSSRTPAEWGAIIDEFHKRNVQLLVALTNGLWSGGAVDGDLQRVGVRPAAGACCDPSDPGCVPGALHQACALDLANDPGCGLDSNWGLTTLAPGFMAAASPYVQELSANHGVTAWELWNEANNDVTALCPANYAQLLAQARDSWGDIGIVGPSLLSVGSGSSASDYLSQLIGSDPIQARGGVVPWDRVMLHPYPDEANDEDPYNFLANQAAAFATLPNAAPLWFTEIGYQGGSDSANGCYLTQVYEAARDLAEHTFWFALYDDVPNYGLIDSKGTKRAAFSSFGGEHSSGGTDTTTDPQNCGSCGNVCDPAQLCQSWQCVTPVTECGNGVCEAGEDCTSCDSDCGACHSNTNVNTASAAAAICGSRRS